MNTVLLALAVYFGTGMCALAVLDILTHRIRSRLPSASLDAQSKMVATGNYIGYGLSKILVVFALWLLWPVAIYGALTSPEGDKTNE